MLRLTEIGLAAALCYCLSPSFAAASCNVTGAQERVLDVESAIGERAEALVYEFKNQQWLVPVSALGYHSGAVVTTCVIDGVPHALLDALNVASYDARSQKLTIDEKFRSTTRRTVSAVPPAFEFSPVEPGLRSIVDFDVLRSSQQTKVGAFIENTIRTNEWLFYSSTTLGNLNYGAPKAMFLDSYARTEKVANRSYLQLGDSAYSSGLTGRSIRLTGLSFGRGIAINPSYLPYSYTSVNGTSVVPSTMEVFVNQQLLQKQSIDAGPFSFTNMAGPIGYGEYNVLIRDALGRVQVAAQPFYNSLSLIAKDFVEYEVNIGRIRDNYGLANYKFGGLAQVASLRYGLAENFTVGGQLLHGPGSASFGVKPVYRIGTFGIVDGTFQLDRDRHRTWSVGVEHATNRYSMRVQYANAQEAYGDVLVDSHFPMPQRTLAIAATYRLKTGSVSASHVDTAGQIQGKTVLDSLTVQYPVNTNLTLVATASSGRNNSQANNSIFIGAVISFGNGVSAFASVTSTPDGTSSQSSISQSPGAARGFGYELAMVKPPNAAYVQGLATWNADLFRGELEANNKGTAELRLRTGAVFTKDSFLMGRPSADAFVLVDTSGVAGVEVGGPSDRYVTTNEHGFALFPGLSSNVAQKLSVNVESLPLDIAVSDEQKQVLPPTMGIVRARFVLSKVNPVMVHLRDTEDTPVSKGSAVLIGERDRGVIGSEGSLYLSSPVGINRIAVNTKKGECVFDLTTPLFDKQILRASRCD